MPDPLSAEKLAELKAEHRDDGHGSCWKCWRDAGDPMPRPWPCDAALLLAELERQAEYVQAVEAIYEGLGLGGHHVRGGMEAAHPRHDGINAAEFLSGLPFGLLGPATSEELAR